MDKMRAVESLGGTVVLHGDSYSDASEHAWKLRDEMGLHFVHPCDDLLVIAGQGTIAEELLRQAPRDVDAVFVPIGGGGLIAGMAVYLQHRSPHTKIIGVEPVDSATMHDSIAAGRGVTLDQVGIFADGVAVKQVGEHTFDLTRRFVDEIVLVDTDEICAAIKDIFDDNRAIVEPAGALLRSPGQSAGRWNISLFHYRNHGAAFGRVLAGMEVPPGERRALQAFPDGPGHACVDETKNPACQRFLQARRRKAR